MHDPANDTWTTKTAMPTPRKNFAIAVLNDKIYTIGGRLTSNITIIGNATNIVEVYTPIGYGTPPLPTPSPSNNPDSTQPFLTKTTAIIAGAVAAGTIITATTILVYDHKHPKHPPTKNNQPT
jgi:hypothetical protein